MQTAFRGKKETATQTLKTPVVVEPHYFVSLLSVFQNIKIFIYFHSSFNFNMMMDTCDLFKRSVQSEACEALEGSRHAQGWMHLQRCGAGEPWLSKSYSFHDHGITMIIRDYPWSSAVLTPDRMGHDTWRPCLGLPTAESTRSHTVLPV